MDQAALPRIRAAEIAFPCEDLAATLAFFTDTLGFQVEQIFPADAPVTAAITGYGVRLRLNRAPGHTPPDTTLTLRCDGAPPERTLTAPNGLRVELVDATRALDIPGDATNREWVLTRDTGDGWGMGRAGMQYRDLIPSRLGGRFIASHIRIPDGGDVPDYVHYHKVRFQMIFCRSGWVRVVYEDQGEPFVLEAGDCVLQPPEIRHRVLEASAGLEVIEIGCPAVHETWADHALELPNGIVAPDRSFSGQRFVRHVARATGWRASGIAGFAARDTGIGAATGGLAGVRVLRAEAREGSDDAPSAGARAAGEFHFVFVLEGALRLEIVDSGGHELAAGDCAVIPGGAGFTLAANPGTELLEVTLPPT